MSLRLVLLLGIASLFADWLYEGARAALPQFLATLGATAFLIGLVFGLGDALSYSLRILAGPLADKRGKYWGETFVGYGAQIISISLLAIAPSLPYAVALILAERISKALRTPARDRIVAEAGGELVGKAFGIHASLDQVGAVLGAITTTAILFSGLGYRALFLVLVAPGAAALAALYLAYKTGVKPRRTTTRFDVEISALALAQFLFGASLMHISLEMYKFSSEPWIGSAIFLTAAAAEIPSSFCWGIGYDKSKSALLLGPLFSIGATLAFSQRGILAGLLGALSYAAAISYEVAIKAHVGRTSGGAAQFAVINASFGLGHMVGGAVYGYLIDVGKLAMAPPLSIAFALSSIFLINFVLGREKS